ncbi:hypothetical protein H2200_010794 [Cladophialophora chaetospira]|uniref:DUF1996 domain-containing protein n=1 Tax=Cladophialophora chaetospira TaxID=386627 RepID=A0AA38X0S1_9EURO|nr:hypothetical protein H2200_010794 [Cladophialophora chaetospira]
MANPRVKLKIGTVLLAFLLMTVPAQAFFRNLCHGELGNARVDPIVAPGEPSQHLHVLFGASNIGFDPTLEELLDSNCTSCMVLQDKSVYWAPRMYFQHANGTFQIIPTSGGLTAYYFTESDLVYKDPVKAFPQNFRMVAGSPFKRTFYGPTPDPPTSEWTASDMTQQSLMEKALGFNCLNYNAPPEASREYHYLRNKTFLDAQCADGVRAELMFPSCWNGKDLDSANHSTHVAYPDGVQTGKCPDGFPVRLPAMFFETIYQTNLFAGVDGEFAFSNGDPTGYGYHGDFMCAWDDGVLQDVIDTPSCNLPNQTSGNVGDCSVFKLQGVNDGTTCKMETPEALQNEQVDFVQQLPGNVQVQSGPQSATVGPVPGATAPPATSSPSANSTESPSPAVPTPGPTAEASAASSAATQSPCTSGSQRTITSSYMANGVNVNMILIEEVVTVTVSDDANPTGPFNRKRHVHKHGHQFGRL